MLIKWGEETKEYELTNKQAEEVIGGTEMKLQTVIGTDFQYQIKTL